MSWYYAINQEQKGPVSEEEFQQLAQSGVITPKTLVWQEGMPQWLPHGQIQTAAAAPAGSVTYCSACGQSFAPDQVIRIGGVYACAACKPLVVQKIQEGGQFQSGDGMSPDALKETDYSSEVIDCISRGARTYFAGFFSILGTSALVFLLIVFINAIPILSVILGLLFQGPIFGGYWLYMVRRAREDDTSVSDAFSGFSNGFLQLMLVNIVSNILIYVPLIPGAILFAIGIFTGRGEAGAILIVGGIVLFAGFLAMIYLVVVWFFSMPLIIDKRMNFWPAMSLSRAMVSKHWWSNFGIGFLFGLMAAVIVGFIAVIAGVSAQSFAHGGSEDELSLIIMLVVLGFMGLTGPLLFAAYGHRYNDIFNRLAVQHEF